MPTRHTVRLSFSQSFLICASSVQVSMMSLFGELVTRCLDGALCGLFIWIPITSLPSILTNSVPLIFKFNVTPGVFILLSVKYQFVPTHCFQVQIFFSKLAHTSKYWDCSKVRLKWQKNYRLLPAYTQLINK